MTVTAIRLGDGTDVAAETASCEDCGKSMADHNCNGGASTATVTISRGGAGVARKAPSEHPTCAHCGGRVHFNMSGTAINAECIVRQYALDKAIITDPNQKTPVLTIEMMGEISDWAKSLATPLSYGKMESAAGGAGTYSGLRPKTGRKKKAVAAAPGSQIQDMAANEDIEPIDGEAPAPKKGKGKGKSRKAKTASVVAPETTTEDEEIALLVEAEPAENGHEDIEEVEEPVAVAAAPTPLPTADAEREERRRRRAERKALAAKLNG